MKNITPPRNDFEKNDFERRDSPGSISMSPNLLRNMLIGVLVASFIFGGIAGLVFGTLAVNNSSLSSWISSNIFGQQVTAGTGSIVTQKQTVSVNEESSTVDAVMKVEPSVVSIVVTQDVSKYYSSGSTYIFPFGYINPQDNTNQGQPSQQEVGAGTGFIISADGMILTNKHVVDTANAQYTVVMNDGKKYDARIVATDPLNDIALVKIDASNLPVATLGDSSTLQAGQTVIAIGNALGEYTNTVTKGVISGLSRTVTAGDNTGSSETLSNIIQTDAAINFGNSGGPLINLEGQVIGINTAINQSGQLVGFAIPINQVKKDVESVNNTGKIVKPFLGVRYLVVDSTVAKQNNLSVNYGVLVVRGDTAGEVAVAPGSPADKAGIVENDIILEINGQKLNEDHTLANEIQKYAVGDKVSLLIMHQGQQKTVEATLAEAK